MITNGTSHVSHITDGVSYNETFKNITNRIHELEMGQRSKLNIALIKYLDLINIVEIKNRHGNQTELDRFK